MTRTQMVRRVLEVGRAKPKAARWLWAEVVIIQGPAPRRRPVTDRADGYRPIQ